MKIDVRHIAKLAKLHIGEDDSIEFERGMRDILDMVENLPEITEVMTRGDGDAMELRPDTISPSLARDETLQNAPQKQAGCIVVPKTVTGG